MINNNIKAIARHLKKAHSINPSTSALIKKRTRERTTIDIVILRGIDVNIKAEKKRRKELINVGLNKTTLKFLYLK